MADNPTPWQMAADEVLAVMLDSQEGFERARYELSVQIAHFPPGPYRETVRALDAVRMTGGTPHITTLHTDSKVDLTWLSDRYVLAHAASKLRGPVLTENVRRMKEYATAYAHREIMAWGVQALVAAETREKRAEVVSTVMTRLGQDHTDDIKDAHASVVADDIDALLAEEPRPGLNTGIVWLDVATGGIQRGNLWIVAAPYKRRKSTLARIMALNQALAGYSVTIAALEGSQREWALDFVCMLAVRWLHANGHWEKTYKGIPLHEISTPLLLNLGNNYKTVLPDVKVQAISAGVKAYRALGERLRIYDAQPQHGGLGTLESVITVINRDMARYKADVIYVDHLQEISAGLSSEFEDTTRSVRTLRNAAVAKDVSIVLLAQLNEEAVKFGPRSASAGIKGGGAAPAAADKILTTGYPKRSDDTEDTDRLLLKVAFARRGAAGLSESFAMHPPTGWLIPTEVHTIDNSAVRGTHASRTGE